MRSFAESERGMLEKPAPATATLLEKVMSKYTAEQVERAAIGCENMMSGHAAPDMLRAYAALLRERESAKTAVSDEMVNVALTAMYGEQFADISGKAEEIFRLRMRAALEAVAPMLSSARVPDETADMLQDAWRDIAKISGSALLAGEKKSQTVEQRRIVYSLACSALAAVGCVYQEITGKSPMLAADPKPEMEE